MTLSNPAIVAVSGVILAGAYLAEPASMPYAIAVVAATWARVYFTRTADKSTLAIEYR